MSLAQGLSVNVERVLEFVVGPYLCRNPFLEYRAFGRWKVHKSRIVTTHSSVPDPNEQTIDVLRSDSAVLNVKIPLRHYFRLVARESTDESSIAAIPEHNRFAQITPVICNCEFKSSRLCFEVRNLATKPRRKYPVFVV